MPREVEAVYVVSSGSIDTTNEIVRSYCEKNSKIKLLTEYERRGKASAMNRLLELGEEYDVVISMGGDNVLSKGALDELLKRFAADDIGMCYHRTFGTSLKYTSAGVL